MTAQPFAVLAAEVYVRGGRFALDDSGIPLIVHPEHGALPEPLIDACQVHSKSIAELVRNGIAAALNGWQPTLPGLEHPNRLETA